MGDNFHELRRKGIGSSDAPVIMKASSWKTPFQLYEEKLGLTEPTETNWAQERGLQLEPRARAHYEILNEMELPAMLVEHKDYPFLRASLDGCNTEHRRILEIKCPGKYDHATALEGRVPEKYYPQLQHQLLVTGFERLDYYSFDGERGVLVIVEPDFPYMQRLLEAELQFWDLVQKKEPPDFEDGDWRRIRKKGLTNLITLWKIYHRKLLQELEPYERVQIKGVRFRKRSTNSWECQMMDMVSGEGIETDVGKTHHDDG